MEARIAERVPPGLRRDLEHLLEETADAGVTRFVWLRQFEPGSNSADANRLLGTASSTSGASMFRTHPGSVPTPEGSTWPRSACSAPGSSSARCLPVNPAAAVRGPKHVVTKGATPVLSPAEARKLLESIDTHARAGLRDRALLSVMLYSFARVSAVLGMRRQDYFRAGQPGLATTPREGWEATPQVPAHHRAAAALDGGTLDHAQQIAGHASPKTTKLYDRTSNTVTVDEIERIVI